jgi:site-specific DNA-cytosine methylase
MNQVRVIDVWAGVSSFSDGFTHAGCPHSAFGAFIEWNPLALSLISALYVAAVVCGDFFTYMWRQWIPEFQNYWVIVCGGPSCCHLSTAGKQLRREDPRAKQGIETARLAVLFKAKVILLENVVGLVDELHLSGEGLDARWLLEQNASLRVL